MTRLFDPSLLESHDLYHAKYGRGAVIIAIRKDRNDVAQQGKNKSDKYIARLFNSRDPDRQQAPPPFDPVLSIVEESGLVKMTIRYEFRYPSQTSSYPPLKATIERVIPVDQVTLEFVRDNQST